MARSRFDRLGDHRLQNKARQVRERAAAGDPEAIAEAAKIDRATTLEALRQRCWEILRAHLAYCDSELSASGLPSVPKAGERTPPAYADALEDWADANTANLPLDTPVGRLVTQVRHVAHILRQLDCATSFRLGLILGYGFAENYYLMLREFADGPAIARERWLADARSAGAKARQDNAAYKNREIAQAFLSAWRGNPHITPNSWAKTNAQRFGKSADRIRRLASDALKASKATGST